MKQFKNLILAGALVVGLAGFAVSCNKYSDDIEEIRFELNKLATKDDVATQISSLQSALSAAQSATNDAKAVEGAKKELEEITGAIADSITSIELVYSHTLNHGGMLEFTTIVEKENVFGKNLKNEITFTKGKQIQRPTTFVVRVSPANAELTPEMISLVNSKGQNLDELVEVLSVKRYNGLLTTKADDKGAYTKPRPVAGSGTLEVAAALIDNEKQHATTVQYNYGQISSVKNAEGKYVNVIRNYSEGFQTVYIRSLSRRRPIPATLLAMYLQPWLSSARILMDMM